jgi:protein TonB
MLVWSVVPVPHGGRDESLALFDVRPPPPPPPVSERPARAKANKSSRAAASPPNLAAVPVAIAAPPPIIVLPTPIVLPPVAALGPDMSAGASDRAGAGTGSGATGSGLGDGTGVPSGGGTSARQIRGGIYDRDYPRAARRAEIEGTVIGQLTIGADGKVHACDITRSSGNAELDATTCRLILKRFRYAPARDARGTAIEEVRSWKQVWWLEPLPEEPSPASAPR